MADYKIVDADQLDADLTTVANAIRAKTGGGEPLPFPAGYAAAIESISGGGGIIRESDVNFYDYDGSLLYAYTLEEIQSMEALPPAPVPPKDYLLFEEWNWTLAQLQEVNCPVDVGAVYKTVDGRTYAVLELEEESDLAVTMTVKVWYYGDLSLPVLTVDWGDGSGAEEFYATATDGVTHKPSHTYAQPGTYTVALASGESTLDLGSPGNASFLGAYNSTLTEVYMGTVARLTNNSFNRHTGLRHITMNSRQPNPGYYSLLNCYNNRAAILPSAAKTSNPSAFESNYSLALFSLPYGLTQSTTDIIMGSGRICRITVPPAMQNLNVEYCQSLQEVVFAGTSVLQTIRLAHAASLREITLPDSLQALANNAFQNAYSLKTLTIPENVTSIGSYAFNNTNSLKRLTFRPTTPPTVSNANAFTNFPAGCVIEVPAGTLEAYQNATNYTAVAAQMVEV